MSDGPEKYGNKKLTSAPNQQNRYRGQWGTGHNKTAQGLDRSSVVRIGRKLIDIRSPCVTLETNDVQSQKQLQLFPVCLVLVECVPYIWKSEDAVGILKTTDPSITVQDPGDPPKRPLSPRRFQIHIGVAVGLEQI